MASSPYRTVWFSLSKALSENQPWAVGAFPTIIQRATGYSEGWTLVRHTCATDSGVHTWQYHVQGTPEVDPVVDHLIHELTDCVLLMEWHTVTEDRFLFGNMLHERPERSQDSQPEQADQQTSHKSLDQP